MFNQINDQEIQERVFQQKFPLNSFRPNIDAIKYLVSIAINVWPILSYTYRVKLKE
jgi:hypothetical protein